MSTPVSLTSLGTIITAVMQHTVLTGVPAPSSDPRPQNSHYAQLAVDVGALQAAAGELAAGGSLTGAGVSNANPGAVAISTDAPISEDSYHSVVVNSLAQAQVTSSSSTYSDSDTTAVATGGSLTIGGVTVNVSGSTTLQGLADDINHTGGSPVSASVVRSAGGRYSLVLTGNQTGAASAFTVTNNLTGGTGITFGDNTQEAADASATVDGVTVTSATNTISSAIPGAALTLLQANSSTTITLTATTSSGGTPDTKTLLQNFVTAYNNLAAFGQSQQQGNLSGDPTSIANSGLLGTLMTSLSGQLSAPGAPGTIQQSLAQVGISFGPSGTLTFDEAAFDKTAASGTLSGVQNSLAGPNGLFSAISATINDSIGAGGLIQVQTSTEPVANQIASLQNQLTLEQRLLLQQQATTSATLSTLTSQHNALTALSQQYASALA